MATPLTINVGSVIGPSLFDWETCDFLQGFTASDVRMYVEWHRMETGELPSLITLDIGACRGGMVYEALDIVTYLRALQVPIAVHVRVLAASAATLLMCAADRGALTASDVAEVMFHKPLYWETGGNATDLRAMADELDNTEAAMRPLYVGRLGKTDADWQMILAGARGADATWYTASGALAEGFVDAVVPVHLAVTTPATSAELRRSRVRAAVASLQRLHPAPVADPSPVVMSEKPKNKHSGVLTSALTAFASALGLKVVAEADEHTAAEDAPSPSAAAHELADGAGSIYCDGDLAEGVAVYTDEALTMLAGAGDYSLADGRTVTVDDAGTVTTIAAASGAADAAPAATSEAIEAAVSAAVAAAVAPIRAQLARAQSDLKAAQARLKATPGTAPRASGEQTFTEAAAPRTDQRTKAAALFSR
jgi:ATP-dependent protease ClpP protease subunit